MVYDLKSPVKLSELVDELQLNWNGEDAVITSVSSNENSVSGSLVFSKTVNGLVPGRIAVLPELSGEGCDCPAIISKNIRMDFVRCLDYLEREIGFSHFEFKSKIHPTVMIGENVVIESGCEISEGVVLEHNVVIHSGTSIGSNTRVRANSSIGGDGFGFERLSDGRPIRFPHLGGVSIGSNVEIGSNTCIAKGTLGDTVIEDDVKIDNLVHVSHNCCIKRGTFLIACSEISGGVKTGRNAWIGPNSSIMQKVSIGDGALIGIGAVVLKDVSPNTVYAGNPAKKLRDI